MSLRSRAVTFNIGTGVVAGGTVSQDHFLGEAPKAIIFFWSGSQNGTGQAAAAGNWRAGMGFANCVPGTPVNSGVCCVAQNATAGGSRGARAAVSATSSVLVPLPGGTGLSAALHVSAVTATQFTVMIDTQFTAGMRITAICLAGEDITNVAVGVATGPVATGTFDTTGLGFTPQGGGRSLLLLAGTLQDVLDTADLNAQVCFGAAISSASRCVIGASSKNAVSPTVSKRYNYDGECGGLPSIVSAGSATNRKDFDSWISDGFRLNVLELTKASELCPYMVIEGPRFAIKSGTTSGTLNDRVAVTGVGFRPEAGLVWSTHAALSAQDVCADEANISLGAWSQRYDQQDMAGSDQNGVTTSVASAALDYFGCYLGLTAAGAIESAMGLATIDDDGATYYMSNATPVTGKNFFTVFMGPASSAPAARATVASKHIWSWM